MNTATPATTSEFPSGSNIVSSLKEYIKESVSKQLRDTFKIIKDFNLAKGEKKLNKENQLEIETASGEKMFITAKHIQNAEQSIIEKINKIPFYVKEDILNKKKAKKRSGNQEAKMQPPVQFRSELVEFFKNANLGSYNGVRLQDCPEMAVFFTSGIANLVFGVSLLNVWGYQNKISSKNYDKVVLDANAKKHLKEAIGVLHNKKKAAVAEHRASGDAVKLAAAEEELKDFDNGVIKNKDYMTLFITYKYDHTDADKLAQIAGFESEVKAMIDITKHLNQEYGKQIASLRPEKPKVVRAKVEKAPASPRANARKSTSASPAPAVAKAAAPVLAPVATSRAASASPAPAPVAAPAPATKGKKAAAK